MHPTSGGNIFQGVTNRNTVTQHRAVHRQINQGNFMALWYGVAQDQAVGQHRACRQSAVVGHNGNVVARLHADGQWGHQGSPIIRLSTKPLQMQ